ncbi:hypothetical protein A5893_14755 [Pedobacter psychrophilus]|uniref:Uncharacterized protein n=1 Tax=Pedobacter psychrophilus TaxID=1826909 RepID=A0A179DC73_9SPHI|nr:hypothetical protein [Pedobacter psychrophilus]OAQ38063.1 hypothetical protein A5893_14755 [Pedobacter psychrophilus]
MDSLKESQNDMKMGYGYGSVGILISGIFWISSSFVFNLKSPIYGIWTLIIGGVFIFPLSMLFGKILGIKGNHNKKNQLGKLAMEGTIWMIICIPLAYGLSLTKVEWFFQGMMIIIGGRYLTFATIYGTKLYWILGATLILASYILFTYKIDGSYSAFTGGLIEVLFSIILFVIYRNSIKESV